VKVARGREESGREGLKCERGVGKGSAGRVELTRRRLMEGVDLASRVKGWRMSDED
jgi:hypothetical protein